MVHVSDSCVLAWYSSASPSEQHHRQYQPDRCICIFISPGQPLPQEAVSATSALLSSLRSSTGPSASALAAPAADAYPSVEWRPMPGAAP
jgi:hypothetical protein